MNTKLINTIKKLDLSTYEAKVYITLNSLIKGTAEEISREAGIPKSKSYDVLKNLSKKNLIKINCGKPIIYEIIPPKEGFRNRRVELIKDLYQCEEKLNEIYEQKVSQVQAPIWLVSNEEKILDKEIELIKSAKRSVNIRIGYISEKELDKLIKTFKNLKHSINIKILTQEECVINNEIVNVIEVFKRAKIKNLNIEKAEIPFVKMIIKDQKEMFHIYAKQDEETKEAISNTLMGIWNRYEDVSKNYHDRFEKQFKQIRIKKQKRKEKKRKNLKKE